MAVRFYEIESANQRDTLISLVSLFSMMWGNLALSTLQGMALYRRRGCSVITINERGADISTTRVDGSLNETKFYPVGDCGATMRGGYCAIGACEEGAVQETDKNPVSPRLLVSLALTSL